MVGGGCPYPDCDYSFLRPLDDDVPLPIFDRWECEHCHRIVWTRHSRVDPWSMTEPDFLAAYEVDEATKTIRARAA